MFVLLPNEYKKKLLTQYRFRLLTVFFTMLFFVVTTGIALLASSYFIQKEDNKEALSQKEVLEKSISAKNNGDFEKTLSDLKKDISVLSTPDHTIYPTIKSIVDSKPENVKINRFSYSFEQDGKSTLTVSGVAGTRKDLLLFANKLKENKNFSTVDLPISNLAKETKITFGINLVGNF